MGEKLRCQDEQIWCAKAHQVGTIISQLFELPQEYSENEKWKSAHFQKIAEAIHQRVDSRPTTALVGGGGDCQTIGRGWHRRRERRKATKPTRPLSPALQNPTVWRPGQGVCLSDRALTAAQQETHDGVRLE